MATHATASNPFDDERGVSMSVVRRRFYVAFREFPLRNISAPKIFDSRVWDPSWTVLWGTRSYRSTRGATGVDRMLSDRVDSGARSFQS